jgi:hypothetical protein
MSISQEKMLANGVGQALCCMISTSQMLIIYSIGDMLALDQSLHP